MSKKVLTAEIIGIQIQEAWGEFIARSSSLVTDAMDLGDRLAAMKRKLPHGKFTPWIEANVPDMSPRHARRFMVLAKSRDKINAGNFRNMEQALAALTTTSSVVPALPRDTVRSADKKNDTKPTPKPKTVPAKPQDVPSVLPFGDDLPAGCDVVEVKRKPSLKNVSPETLAAVKKSLSEVAAECHPENDAMRVGLEQSMADADPDDFIEATAVKRCDVEPLEDTPFRSWIRLALQIPATDAEAFWTATGCPAKGKRSRMREVLREVADFEWIEKPGTVCVRRRAGHEVVRFVEALTMTVES